MFCRFLLVIFSSLLIANVKLEPSQSQTNALESLYLSTKGPSWLNKHNWMSSVSPCNWNGIICDETRADINTIHLNGNNLDGTIPDTFSPLSQLTLLNLAKNKLSSSIPLSVGFLPKVGTLNLLENRLSGSLPSINSSNSFEAIWLDHNELNGTFPDSFKFLTNLISLDINSNKLSGTLPDFIGNSMTQLETLDIDTNNFTGTIPSSMGSLKELDQLYLNNNQLEGPIPDSFSKLRCLQYFIFNSNNLTGEIPSWVCSVSFNARRNDFDCPHPSCCTIGTCDQCPSQFPVPTLAEQQAWEAERESRVSYC